MSHHGPARLGHDGGGRDPRAAAHLADVEDHVVGVLLQRVVHAGFVAAAASVVVHPQPAADVEVGQARPQIHQPGVEPRRFDQRRLERPHVVDLAAQVEVHQGQPIEHVVGPQQLDHLQHLGHEEAELAALAAGGVPPPRAGAGQLDPHPDAGPHAVGLGLLDDQPQLAELLDHGDHVAADLLGQDHRLDKAGVLEAVADHQGFGVVHQSQYGQQLGLAAGLQAEIMRGAKLQQVFHDVPLLIDLDGVHPAVVAGVVELAHGRGKGVGDRLQTVVDDARETKQQGGRQIPLAQLVHQLFEIDAKGHNRALLRSLVRASAGLAVGVHAGPAVGADRHVAAAPAAHAVELGAGLGGPIG